MVGVYGPRNRMCRNRVSDPQPLVHESDKLPFELADRAAGRNTFLSFLVSFLIATGKGYGSRTPNIANLGIRRSCCARSVYCRMKIRMFSIRTNHCWTYALAKMIVYSRAAPVQFYGNLNPNLTFSQTQP